MGWAHLNDVQTGWGRPNRGALERGQLRNARLNRAKMSADLTMTVLKQR
jgi:hypothetical protein